MWRLCCEHFLLLFDFLDFYFKLGGKGGVGCHHELGHGCMIRGTSSCCGQVGESITSVMCKPFHGCHYVWLFVLGGDHDELQ
jgi:hypothetical protein